MPYTLLSSFDKFIENITIGGDTKKIATSRRDSIFNLLKDKFTIVEAFPTGSLLRNTGLKNVSDVDVIVVLHYGKHIENKTPKKVLETVQAALSGYKAVVKKNGQAVTLYFKTWPNVDIVPAKHVTVGNGKVIKIPDMNTGRWIETDPKTHDSKIAGLPLRGRYLIRMIKCWNNAHSNYFLSYHIEKVALKTESIRDGSNWAEDDWAWALNKYFEKAIEMTESSTSISSEYGTDEWVDLRNRLRKAKEISYEAWQAIYSDKNVEKAVGKLKVLFGDKFPTFG